MNNRMELYKAVRHEISEYQEDHGFNLVEMWNVVNGRTKHNAEFWREVCLSDYRRDKETVSRAEEFRKRKDIRKKSSWRPWWLRNGEPQMPSNYYEPEGPDELYL